jgi:hypothetical protein
MEYIGKRVSFKEIRWLLEKYYQRGIEDLLLE